VVEDGLGDNTTNLLVLRDSDSGESVAVYCQLDKAIQGPVVLEWDAVVAQATGDGGGRVYKALGLDNGEDGGHVLWDIVLQDGQYQDDGRDYAMAMNDIHHFKVVVDTHEQQYSAFVDGQILVECAPFNENKAQDAFLLGLRTLEASTAALGVDNILIKGRPGVVLPGVNLLLMSE